MKGNRFENFTYSVLQLAKTAQCVKSRKLAQHGLKSTEALSLLRIYGSAEKALTASELARICDIDKAQVSRTTGELIRKGLIFRNDLPGRRYKQKYHLTPEGDAIAKDLMETTMRMQSTLRKGVTAAEMERFYVILERICENFKDASDILE